MLSVPKNVEERLRTQIKRFKPILEQAIKRDISEADTTNIIRDFLCDALGYDKYVDITSETAVKGPAQTFCDIGLKIDDALRLLIEVKSVGVELKDAHIRQALNYAVNAGLDWVVLTNGIHWFLYRVIFGQPIDFENVFAFDLLEASPKDEDLICSLFAISKEGMKKEVMKEYYRHKQATSKFLLAAIINSDPVLYQIRKEIRKIRDVLVELDEISKVITSEVFKREVIENEQAEIAAKEIKKLLKKTERKIQKEDEATFKEGRVESQSSSDKIPNKKSDVENKDIDEQDQRGEESKE